MAEIKYRRDNGIWAKPGAKAKATAKAKGKAGAMPPDQKTKDGKIICRFWLKDKCTAEGPCRFAHHM